MPRTVCTNSGLAGLRSIFRRRRLTCTSTARSLTEPPLPASDSRGTVSPGAAGKDTQHLALAVGQTDDFLAFAQFAAREMIDERPEADRFDRWRRRRLGALEDIGDAQRQLARLERLRQIIVSAHLQTFDAALGGIARGQHQDRHVGIAADRFGEIETRIRPAS